MDILTFFTKKYDSYKVFLWIVLFPLIACQTPSDTGNPSIHSEKAWYEETAKHHEIQGKDYYVSPLGIDTLEDGQGLSQEKPFQTIQFAHDLTQPGDTVHIMEGRYLAEGWRGALRCTRSGLPNGYITYKALEGHHPVIYTQAGANNTWEAFGIDASYIIIEGLEFAGHNHKLNYEDALDSFNDHQAGIQEWEKISQFNTCGISLGQSYDQKYNHHFIVRNCIVHSFPATGVLGSFSDYISIENCEIYDNSWYTMYGTSGISLYEIHNSTNSSDIRNNISGNILYNNYTSIPYVKDGQLTDGNGIILDSYMLSNQDTPKKYDGFSLVENNVVFNNGGGGINVYLAANAIVRNNTVYANCWVMKRYGDIFIAESENVQVYNNISVCDQGSTPLIHYNNKGFDHGYNLYNQAIQAMAPSSLVMDPMWVQASTDPDLADFGLLRESPAIDAGTINHGLSEKDFLGNPRISRESVDLGAIEFH